MVNGCQGIVYQYGTTDICYWLVHTEQTAQISEDICTAQGGMLAYIPNQEALDVIRILKEAAGSVLFLKSVLRKKCP